MHKDYDKIHTHNTAAWRLWNLRYSVNVPELALYSAGYLAHVGSPRSGNTMLDRTRINPMERTWMTAAGLAIIYSEGNAFSFTDPRESIQMYVDIQKHIQDWHDMTYAAIPPSSFPPIEDLRIFEAMAVEVHNVVMTIMPQADVRSALMDKLLRFGRARNATATRRWEQARVNDATGNIKMYESKVDRIEMYVYSGKD